MTIALAAVLAALGLAVLPRPEPARVAATAKSRRH